MSEGLQSGTKNENLNGVSNQKRDGDFHDSDLVTKKSKINALGVESVEKAEENLGIHEPEKNQPVVTESGGHDDNILQKQESKELAESNQNGLLEDKASCGPKSLLPVVSNCIIEADAAEDKGYRHTMEDAWVVLPDASLEFPGQLRCSHFAIYDGHGGRLAAEYAQKHLHANVLSAGLPRELMDVKAAKKAILDGFRRTDDSLLQESAAGGWQDGATAVCVWVLGQTVFIANIGDAKAVVARLSTTDGLQNHLDGVSPLKAIVLTREHKAIYPQERVRIQKAGGSVSSNGRLQGRLEVSRAFGDRQFKKVGVISTPDVHSFDLTKREHFIILGCDGLWGVDVLGVYQVFGPSDAVDFVQKLLKVVKEMDQKFQVSEKTKSAFAAAEQQVSSAGSAIIKNRYVLTGPPWVTGAFNKVAKAAGEIERFQIAYVTFKDSQGAETALLSGATIVDLSVTVTPAPDYQPPPAASTLPAATEIKIGGGANSAVQKAEDVEGLSVNAVSRRLVREAVRERHCKDNCTAIVIVFRHK
ncbi:hypothetical protein HHK36_006903 [Tetracentron sinense]|uniref:PPM-type phosphatase domain-containing protein n=1 Tax=Tetracentron sinense TaxID=13715 RepID=A0A834ZSJ9_TETSI|nr:hypothetical protein HHK36_006903 [Tetracentron sinense]